MNSFPHQRMLFANIAAKDSHAAHTCRQSKECLVHCPYNYRTIDLREIRFQIKGHSLTRAFQKKTVHSESKHQYQQCRHHIFCHTFQSSLKIEGKDEKCNDHSDQ